MHDDIFIAYNGPEIGEADEVLRDALDFHFSKPGLVAIVFCLTIHKGFVFC
jgi:hypothetical protein